MTTMTVRTKHGELLGKGHPGYAAGAAAAKAEVVPAIAAGLIRPDVDRVIPFADALKAAETMRASAVTGKIVLDLAVSIKETSCLG